MKTADLIKCLKANKDISDYQVASVDVDKVELYYVLKHLEINRAVKVNKTSATVYVSDGKTTGNSTILITAADDVKSVDKKIKDAVKKAKAAKNVYYPLATKTENITEKKPSGKVLDKIASEVAKAVLAADKFENSWINSLEIFVSQEEKQLITSTGIKHTTYGFKVEFEVIPTATDGKMEYEQYYYHRTNSLDYQIITKKVEEVLQNAKDRAFAKKISDVKIAGDCKVLIKDDMLRDIVDCIVEDSNYQNVFTKGNHYNTNDVISNDSVSFKLVGQKEGCLASSPIDGDGIVLKDYQLIKDGKLLGYHGSQRFGYYLKEENITGNHPVTIVDGKRSEYKKDKHLIIETFSSPQIDESSGYWGGEIRLARYFDGEKYIPLSGFSISGNIYQDLLNVEFSKENEDLSDYSGPKYFIFKNISIH